MARKALMDQFSALKSQTIQTFEGLKKSTNNDILKELYELLGNHLKSNFDQIYGENESRRVEYINKVIENSKSQFEDKLNDVLDSTFVESDDLDDILSEVKRQMMREFKQHFSDEEETLFANDLMKVIIVLLFILNTY